MTQSPVCDVACPVCHAVRGQGCIGVAPGLVHPSRVAVYERERKDRKPIWVLTTFGCLSLVGAVFSYLVASIAKTDSTPDQSFGDWVATLFGYGENSPTSVNTTPAIVLVIIGVALITWAVILSSSRRGS
jgi:hypothetical protein